MAKKKSPASASKKPKAVKSAAAKLPAKSKPAAGRGVPVDAIKHKDTRVNIPTEELRDFMAEEAQAPKTVLYPRDPSLDPQLVWKGKDEQDAQDLAVAAVPIYIQEKIHPQALIDALPRTARADDDQLDLFSNDFNGTGDDFEKKVDFYSQRDDRQKHWTNRMILGDSLLVMTSLAEKEGLKGKVQTVYFDPPYGIKFGSNWQVSTRKRDVKDGKAEDATRQPEQVRAFRDTWQLGIHSYLAYLRDRLTSARSLLTETGSVFVQIGQENVHLVRCLLDEVFGSENLCGFVSFRTTTVQSGDLLGETNDYLLWYANERSKVKYRQLYFSRSGTNWVNYDFISLPNGVFRKMTPDERSESVPLPAESVIYRRSPLTSSSASETTSMPIKFEGKEYLPGRGGWKTNKAGFQKLIAANRLEAYGQTLSFRRYVTDFPYFPMGNAWTDTASGGYGEDKVYVVQTNTKVIERALLMTTDPGDLVLDPTCGSGTTSYVAEQWGRRWITCDTSRVALALARTRLMAGKFPYYLLADSPEGIKKEAELTGRMPPPHPTDDDVRKGFVYKRVPHVTLKSIANNQEIREGMSRAEIDAAISRHADTETLYDQPYEDNKRVRVCGPFSVESLSPHRTISVEDKKRRSEVGDGKTGLKMRVVGPDDFGNMILDNLRKAGVQNPRSKSARLKFDSLDPYAGEWIHGQGTYVDADGKSRRAAICIGPEHGTVGAMLIKEAAKEAVKGIGFDVLVVCGFAFDPSVTEEAKNYGKLVVLPTKMNPDLAMGDELLKKTGAGNLFMVFGEPDVELKKQKDGRYVVEVRGIDVYDPTTGAIRSSSTDDIACWFLDTDYNGESFFVRHAYFTGADEPYEKLKRALRAEIDEAAWSSIYATESRPFDKPAAGKIAVKVINHYGDEVLKVFNIQAAR